MPPGDQGIVDIDQFFGELVEVEPACRHRDRPASQTGADRLSAVADVEPGPAERGIGFFPQG